MSLQLLVELMLLSKEDQAPFTLCYESFLELSNSRQTSLKKAALLQMNVEIFRAGQDLVPPPHFHIRLTYHSRGASQAGAAVHVGTVD